MILDNLENIESYQGMHPGIVRGLRLLRQDFAGQPDGRYEVDGDKIYYMIQSYETRPENNLPEAHRQYADIQCVLEGKEVIAVGPLSAMEEVETHPDRDLWLYHGALERFIMSPGRFMVLFPQDAHAAAIAAGQPGFCRKVVVKVRLD